jgi:hypothetical protein
MKDGQQEKGCRHGRKVRLRRLGAQLRAGPHPGADAVPRSASPRAAGLRMVREQHVRRTSPACHVDAHVPRAAARLLIRKVFDDLKDHHTAVVRHTCRLESTWSSGRFPTSTLRCPYETRLPIVWIATSWWWGGAPIPRAERVGRTRLLANPKGYGPFDSTSSAWQNGKFDPCFKFEI